MNHDAEPICQHCKRIAGSNHCINSHMTSIIDEEEATTLICLICGYKDSERSGLVRHLYNHTGCKIYKCSHCEQCFPQKSQADRHIKTVHNREFSISFPLSVSPPPLLFVSIFTQTPLPPTLPILLPFINISVPLYTPL